MVSTPKGEFAGTHRHVPVSDTLTRLLPLLDAFEITRIANVTGLDDVGIPTVVVTRPNARSLSVSQGKGVSLAAAKVSGIMESIEQCHAEQPRVPLWLASYHERSRQAPVADPAKWPRYTRRWEPEARILWTTATISETGEPLDVPFELVHLDMSLPLPAGSGFFPIGSNGLASGNTLSEAIVHGVCELVERDATALFYRYAPERQAARRLRLDTVDDPICRDLLARFERAGVGVAVWEITSDVGVAAFLCSCVEREFNPFRRIGLARGFGCNLDRAVALSRALSEAAQSRLTRIAGSRDDFQREEVDAVSSDETIRMQQRQLTEERTASRSFAEVPTRRFEFFEDDLLFLDEALAAAGVGPILHVDLSWPNLPLAVVRVLVPGLEGAADVPGYVPGRRALAVGAEHPR